VEIETGKVEAGEQAEVEAKSEAPCPVLNLAFALTFASASTSACTGVGIIATLGDSRIPAGRVKESRKGVSDWDRGKALNAE
jgi:hypothetical protein